MSDNPFVGTWTYRSLLNDPNPKTTFDKLEFGLGEIKLKAASFDSLTGTIGQAGQWSLKLQGSLAYGTPMQIRMQGKGVIGGAEWIYDYIGWLVPPWPNANPSLERPAIVGSVIRTIPHPSGNGGVAPAGFVASFYAVKVG
jgi:hypothetical protein